MSTKSKNSAEGIEKIFRREQEGTKGIGQTKNSEYVPNSLDEYREFLRGNKTPLRKAMIGYSNGLSEVLKWATKDKEFDSIGHELEFQIFLACGGYLIYIPYRLAVEGIRELKKLFKEF